MLGSPCWILVPNDVFLSDFQDKKVKFSMQEPTMKKEEECGEV